MNIIRRGMKMELEHILKCGKDPITNERLTKAQKAHIKGLIKDLK